MKYEWLLCSRTVTVILLENQFYLFPYIFLLILYVSNKETRIFPKKQSCQILNPKLKTQPFRDELIWICIVVQTQLCMYFLYPKR